MAVPGGWDRSTSMMEWRMFDPPANRPLCAKPDVGDSHNPELETVSPFRARRPCTRTRMENAPDATSQACGLLQSAIPTASRRPPKSLSVDQRSRETLRAQNFEPH